MWWKKKKETVQSFTKDQNLGLERMDCWLTPPIPETSNANEIVEKLLSLSYATALSKSSMEEKRERLCELVYGHIWHYHERTMLQLDVLILLMSKKMRRLEVHHQTMFKQWVDYLSMLKDAKSIIPPKDELAYTEALRIRMMIIQEPNPKKEIEHYINNDTQPMYHLCSWMYAYGSVESMELLWIRLLTPHKLLYYALLGGETIRSISMHGPNHIRGMRLAQAKRMHQDFMQGRGNLSEIMIATLHAMPLDWHPNSGSLGNTIEQWYITKIRMTYFPASNEISAWYYAWLTSNALEFDPKTFPIQHSLIHPKTVHLQDFEYRKMSVRVVVYLLLRSPDEWYERNATHVWDLLQNDIPMLQAFFAQGIDAEDIEKHAQRWLNRQQYDTRATAVTLRAAYLHWSASSPLNRSSGSLLNTLVTERTDQVPRILYRAAENILKYAKPTWLPFELWIQSSNAEPTWETWDAMIQAIENPTDQTPLELE